LGWHPVAVVQYTFTQKQYTEQQNGTEYIEHLKIKMHKKEIKKKIFNLILFYFNILMFY